MRSRLFVPRAEDNEKEWQPCFAWWPVRARDGGFIRWVWLESIWYKYDPDSYDYACYLYRIKE